ncbi:MAG: hypothetical protein IJD17_06100, partial [Clostridia bacterium]|nr:hypothetical protein [Clostridia bacterium]
VLEAMSAAFDVDIDYVGSIDDGSWGKLETSLRRMTVSAESENVISTVLHEQIHLMKAWASKAYEALERYTVRALEEEGADVDGLIDDKLSQYKDETGFGYEEAMEEIVADSIENIQNADEFTERFASFLSEEGYTHSEAKGICQKIADFFRRIRDALKSVFDSLKKRHGDNVTVTEAGAALSANIDIANRQLEMFLSISRMMKQRYAEIRAGMADMPEGTVKKMIGYTTENVPVAIIEEDILDGVPQAEWISVVKRTISAKFKKGIPLSGRFVKINAKTKNEFTRSRYSRYLEKNDLAVYGDKFRSANNLDDVVLASTNYINESPKHLRNDSFEDFARGDVLIRAGGNDYSANVIIGLTSGNNLVLYDIVDFKPANFVLKQKSADTLAAMQKQEATENRVSAINNMISQNDPNVKRKSQKAPDSAEVEKLKAQVAKRDGEISQQSEVIDKLKTVIERGGAGTIPYAKISRAVSGILKEYSSKYSSDLVIAELSNIFMRIKNSTNSVEQRRIYRDVLSLADKITSAAEAKTKDSTAFTADCAAFLKDVRKGIAITETQKQDLAAAYGSFSKARNAFMGRVTFKI